MDLSRFKVMWELMALYTFEVDSDLMNENLICIICNKLMIDACESICDCHYCYKCIEEYLSKGDRCCPGGKSQCKEASLVMVRDVFRNLRLNNIINRMSVICPNESCILKIALSDMDQHLRVCDKRLIDCPYIKIGCDDRVVKDSILNHLNSDSLRHSQLMIDSIYNLENEVQRLKVKLPLSEESEIEDRQIEEIGQIGCVREECQNTIATLVKQLGEMEIKVNGEREERMKLVEELRGEIERVRNEGSTKRDNATMSTNDAWKRSEEYRDGPMLKWTKMCANIDADFLWRIDGYTKKIGTAVVSESFYANKYRLCLRLNIGRNGGIVFYYRIMKGDNDDTVQWPMKRVVTLAFIDKRTLMAQNAVTIKCDSYKGNKSAFERPKNDANDWITDLDIYRSLDNSPSVIADDSIVVSCVVTNP